MQDIIYLREKDAHQELLTHCPLFKPSGNIDTGQQQMMPCWRTASRHYPIKCRLYIIQPIAISQDICEIGWQNCWTLYASAKGQWVENTSSMVYLAWWRHQMETFSALLAICAGNSPVTGEFAAQRPVTRSFDVFFDLRLNKRLSKQSWGWWFETLSRPLWRHCNGGIFPVLCICFDICKLTFDILPVHWSVGVIVATALMSLSVWEIVSMVTFSAFGSNCDVTAFPPHWLHSHWPCCHHNGVIIL